MNEIYRPSPVELPSFTMLRRKPSRPPELREPGFDDKFDDTTLFYDSFRMPLEDTVLLIGPPLLNLCSDVRMMRVTAIPSRELCPFRLRQLDRATRIEVTVPPNTARLLIETGFGIFETEIRHNMSNHFAGRRVLLTKQKNNKISWILDWIRFHRDLHGADSVLVYDNGSTDYDVSELYDAIRSLSGLEAVWVVEWPFKWGPVGGLGSQNWDSNFAEYGILEHARWHFLARARSVMVGDIDELLISRSAKSVFEIAERSLTGTVRYFGVWIISVEDKIRTQDNHGLHGHRDFNVMVRTGKPISKLPWSQPFAGCFAKWTVVPKCCPRWSQWKVHTIGKWPLAYPVSRDLRFRHFRPISNNWAYDRSTPEKFDPAQHEEDAELIAAYDCVNWDN